MSCSIVFFQVCHAHYQVDYLLSAVIVCLYFHCLCSGRFKAISGDRFKSQTCVCMAEFAVKMILFLFYPEDDIVLLF